VRGDTITDRADTRATLREQIPSQESVEERGSKRAERGQGRAFRGTTATESNLPTRKAGESNLETVSSSRLFPQQSQHSS